MVFVNEAGVWAAVQGAKREDVVRAIQPRAIRAPGFVSLITDFHVRPDLYGQNMAGACVWRILAAVMRFRRDLAIRSPARYRKIRKALWNARVMLAPVWLKW